MQGNRVTKEQKKVTALAMDFSWTTMESQKRGVCENWVAVVV